MTTITPLVSIKAAYRETNGEVLKAVRHLTDAQWRWQPHPACHSIAFIVWHLARWNDHLQATIHGMTEGLSLRLPPGRQIWESEQLAARWGFPAGQLGESETGTGLDQVASGKLGWPAKDSLLDYAERAFAAADQALSAIDEEQFQTTERLQYDDPYMKASVAKSGTVGNAVMEHLVHNAQHLGEIEYLSGLLKNAAA